MLSDGTSQRRDLAMSRSSPRVGDGFIRLDVDGKSPPAHALSAYHRMGLTSDPEATTSSP
jgi:hypothetical protein